LFGGSGSTLIAAEQTGRPAILMELDPQCCDVIVARYEQCAGQEAVLAGRRGSASGMDTGRRRRRPRPPRRRVGRHFVDVGATCDLLERGGPNRLGAKSGIYSSGLGTPSLACRSQPTR
jgi:hypothetical protein